MSEFAIEPLVVNAWYVAAWSYELDEGPVARKIMGENMVLFRGGDGRAAALEDRCCHRGVRLSLGTAVERGIQCGYHGMVFDASGACVDNPGERLNPSYRVRAFPVIERHKVLWVWTGEPEMADYSRIIKFPYPDMNEDWNFHFGRYDIAANYMFMIDNLMDLTHLGYVHLSTIGGHPDEQNCAELETVRTECGAKFTRWMMNSTPPPAFTESGEFEGQVDRWGEFEYVAPGTVLQWAGAHDAGTGGREDRNKPGGLVFRLLHQATPADENNYHYFFASAVRGLATEMPANVNFHNANREAFLEDKLFIEAQQEAVSQSPEGKLMLREHDKAVAYSRQAIHDMQKAEIPQAAE